MVLSFFVTMWWKVHFTGFYLDEFYHIVYQRFILLNVIFYLIIAFMFLHKNDFITRTTTEEVSNVARTVAGVMIPVRSLCFHYKVQHPLFQRVRNSIFMYVRCPQLYLQGRYQEETPSNVQRRKGSRAAYTGGPI